MSEWFNNQKQSNSDLKRYEEKLREATFNYNRAEGYSNKGKHSTAKTFYNKSESLCEDWIQCYWTDFKYPTAVGSLEPDIPVPFTFADYKAGIDASLSSIISIESSN